MISVGKQARDESGKYPVNENDEEIGAPSEYGNLSFGGVKRCWKLLMCFPRVIASEAKQSIARHNG
jgi:hypothetical protein